MDINLWRKIRSERPEPCLKDSIPGYVKNVLEPTDLVKQDQEDGRYLQASFHCGKERCSYGCEIFVRVENGQVVGRDLDEVGTCKIEFKRK